MPYDEGNNFLIALQARCAESLEEGRPLWAQLVDSDPAKYLSERASFYENFGEHELAVADLDRLFALDQVAALRMRGDILFKHDAWSAFQSWARVVSMHKKELADSAAIDAKSLAATKAEIDLGDDYEQLAETLDKNDYPDAACRAYMRAADFHHGNIPGAERCYELKHWDHYLYNLNCSVARLPSMYLAERAFFYQRQGQYDLALADCEQLFRTSNWYDSTGAYSPKAFAHKTRATVHFREKHQQLGKRDWQKFELIDGIAKLLRLGCDYPQMDREGNYFGRLDE